jgi:glycosyltransferase involved in cell wall biosynthesis
MTAGRGRPSVYYGFPRIPAKDEAIHGGFTKFQKLAEAFPNSPFRFNMLYLGSSSRPGNWRELLALARRAGAKIVYNQNGVAYPAWHGPGWENTNAPMRELLEGADFVVYQSRFCKLSADRFLGARRGESDIVYNPVDTDCFRPPDVPLSMEKELVLLSAGSCGSFYRFESAIEALLDIRKARPARLLVAGRLEWRKEPGTAEKEARAAVARLGLEPFVEFLPPYTQAGAPGIFQRAHLLLHTQYNDACPTTVLEAMACGLPVVYSRSGGTPELVGEEAGVGLEAPLDWENIHPPQPGALGEAALAAAAERESMSAAARRRAVEVFDAKKWIARHSEIFARLLGEATAP